MQVVYISCNPETLARDLTQLRQTHHVHRFATFDQFPYTDHLESGAFLVRK
jgi:tRNA (uracil-5-)-methyltransferase